MNQEYKTPYVNPYEAYGHHTSYGIEETESYAKVHNAPNRRKDENNTNDQKK